MRRRREMCDLVTQDRIVTCRILEALKRRHLDDVGGRRVKGLPDLSNGLRWEATVVAPSMSL